MTSNKNVVVRKIAKAAMLGVITLAVAATSSNAQAQYYRRDDTGAAIAGGIFGLAAGMMIAGAASNSRANRNSVRGMDAEWIAYCARKYRSYDARTNTFLGHDGYRHYCD